MLSLTVRYQPNVTTAVAAHCMYMRHNIFVAYTTIMVWGAWPRLEVTVHVHQCLINLFQQAIIGEIRENRAGAVSLCELELKAKTWVCFGAGSAFGTHGNNLGI